MIISLIEKELCRVQAKKSLNNGRYGNALEWALRSQDNIYVTSIADHFLRVSWNIFLVITFSQHFASWKLLCFPALYENRFNPLQRCDYKCWRKNVYIAAIGVSGEILWFPKLSSNETICCSCWAIDQFARFKNSARILLAINVCWYIFIIGSIRTNIFLQRNR